MITEFLAFPEDRSIAEILEELRGGIDRYSDYQIQYAYVVDAGGRLRGVLRLRDLILARRGDELASSIMISEPVSVGIGVGLEELLSLFDERAFLGIPVVDSEGRLMGVVRRAAVEEAWGKHETRTYMRISGLMSAEEIRTMPTRLRAIRRLSWLTINVVLNIVAASVIVAYQDTLAAVIALAVFLPIISDMSGCSGNQAVAVSIRELALGLVRPYEFLRVVGKEGAVGLLNGLVLGALLGTVAGVWQGNATLGLVVGAALALNTLLAVVLGGTVPLALKSLKLDPALASGPILTTVTDMCGFFLVLSFASVALPRLV